MSFLEEDKTLEFGGPFPKKNLRKKWNRQGKRDARRAKRKNKPKKPIRDFFFNLGQTGIFGERPKACNKCGNAKRAERLWRKETRKRDRNWG